MKVSALCLAGIASGSDKKVPPRHPLQRLGRLVEFTGEIMNSGAFNNKPLRWIQMWELKFANNANRMERNFERGGQRCGYYNPDRYVRNKRNIWIWIFNLFWISVSMVAVIDEMRLIALIDMTVKIHVKEWNRFWLGFQNGQIDTSQNAQVKEPWNIKKIEWANGEESWTQLLVTIFQNSYHVTNDIDLIILYINTLKFGNRKLNL